MVRIFGQPLCAVRPDRTSHDHSWGLPAVIMAVFVGVSLLLGACMSGGSAPGRGIEAVVPTAVGVEEASVNGGDGVVLHMSSVGLAAAAETLITLHGGPGLSLESMEGYNVLAGPDVRVVSYDQRGAGRSGTPGDVDYSLAAQVADLEAIRITLGVETVQLLGQSWGGAIAAAYAATYPDRVSALVLVGAVPLDRAEYLAGQRRFQARVGQLQRQGIIDDVIPSIEDGSCAAAFSSVLPAYLEDPTSDISVRVASCTADTARATYEAFLADDTVPAYADKLGLFDSPTLLVAGEHDVFGPGWLARQREILAAAPNETVLIRDAGHLVIVEQPAATLAAISTFLNELQGS